MNEPIHNHSRFEHKDVAYLGGNSPGGSLGQTSPALSSSDLKELQHARTDRDWGVAVGNLENAKVALDTLKVLINDAVFLDEEAFSNANALSMYQQRMQSKAKRVLELEHEVDALRKEVEKKDMIIRAEVLKNQAANNKIAELQGELDNSKVVFDAHFSELLSKADEIDRLKAIINGLQGTR